MSRRSEWIEKRQYTTVAIVCDSCKAENLGWKRPDSWIEITEFFGWPDWDPESYHFCTLACANQFAQKNIAETHSTFEIKVDRLDGLFQ